MQEKTWRQETQQTPKEKKKINLKFVSIVTQFKYVVAKRKAIVVAENVAKKTTHKQTTINKLVIKKTPRKSALAQPKELDVSITIYVAMWRTLTLFLSF